MIAIAVTSVYWPHHFPTTEFSARIKSCSRRHRCKQWRGEKGARCFCSVIAAVSLSIARHPAGKDRPHPTDQLSNQTRKTELPSRKRLNLIQSWESRCIAPPASQLGPCSGTSYTVWLTLHWYRHHRVDWHSRGWKVTSHDMAAVWEPWQVSLGRCWGYRDNKEDTQTQ